MVRPVGRPVWQQAAYRLADVHDLEFVNPSWPLQGFRAWVSCDEAADDNGDPVHECDGTDKHRVMVNIRRADNARFYDLLLAVAEGPGEAS